jgi:hypothetical protein
MAMILPKLDTSRRRITIPPQVRRRLRNLILGLLAATLFPLIAQDADSTSEFWPEIDVFYKLNDKSRLFGMYTATRPENLRTYADGQTGIHLDLYGLSPFRKHRVVDFADESRSKFLLVRLGYLFSSPKNDSGTAEEHMAITEATGRAHLRGQILLSVRNRLDLRWVEGAPRHRYRVRTKLERNFKIGRVDLTPYAHAEVFYDLYRRDWSRFRYAAGAEWTVTKWFVFEAYYLRQNTWAAVPQFVNATGLVAQFYIP